MFYGLYFWFVSHFTFHCYFSSADATDTDWSHLHIHSTSSHFRSCHGINCAPTEFATVRHYISKWLSFPLLIFYPRWITVVSLSLAPPSCKPMYWFQGIRALGLPSEGLGFNPLCLNRKALKWKVMQKARVSGEPLPVRTDPGGPTGLIQYKATSYLQIHCSSYLWLGEFLHY